MMLDGCRSLEGSVRAEVGAWKTPVASKSRVRHGENGVGTSTIISKRRPLESFLHHPGTSIRHSSALNVFIIKRDMR
jgi:hypothetical protein